MCDRQHLQVAAYRDKATPRARLAVVAMAVLMVVSRSASAHAQQQKSKYPLCATDALHGTVTDVVWSNFETQNDTMWTDFLALNTTTGAVLCRVTSAPGEPVGLPGVAYANGDVFSVMPPTQDVSPDAPHYLYRIGTVHFAEQPTQLCVLAPNLQPAGLWTIDSPPNQSAELILLAQSNDAPQYDVYRIDWTHSPSPTAQCVLQRLSSLDVSAEQIFYTAPGAMDWSARVLYGVMASNSAANDSSYVVSWALDTGATRVSAVKFVPPTPYPYASYFIQQIAVAAVSGAHEPSTVFASWLDVNESDPNYYWGTADASASDSAGTAVVLHELATWPPTYLSPLAGMSDVIWNAQTQQWLMSAFGWSAQSGGGLIPRMFHVNPVSGAVHMTDPLALPYGADAVVLRPAS